MIRRRRKRSINCFINTHQDVGDSLSKRVDLFLGGEGRIKLIFYKPVLYLQAYRKRTRSGTIQK
jgi:hypothetical protein